MDYGILLPLFAYIAGLHLTVKYNLNPFFGAIIATFVPFIVGVIVFGIITGATIATFWGSVVNLQSLLIFLIQFSITYFLFKYLKTTDSIGAYLLLGAAGLFVILAAVPKIIEAVVRALV